MTKPEEIPQDIWDTAYAAMPPWALENYELSPASMVLHLCFAKAIFAERQRNEARIADLEEYEFMYKDLCR